MFNNKGDHKAWSPYFQKLDKDNIVLINDKMQVAEVASEMLMASPPPILGIDCEGLTKGRPLSLLQVCFGTKCYIFDLLVLNPFTCGLEDVFRSHQILKIFHDFCEDESALINQFNMVSNFVFDTQMAHRVISQYTQHQIKVNFEDNNISLNRLLEIYLGVQNTKKENIKKYMMEDDEFWERRPLSSEMLEYASQDVFYLPMVYGKMQQYFHGKTNHRFYQNANIYETKMTVFEKIMSETQKCQKYAFINRHIEKVIQIEPGMVIQAFIKNYQKIGVYCSLNVGISGIILNEMSADQLHRYFDIGDVIQVQVEGFRERSGHAILKFIGPATPTQFTPPQQPSMSSMTKYGEISQNFYYNQYPSPLKGNSTHRRCETYNPMKKALNLNSPEFFPDSSFSSNDTMHNNSQDLDGSMMSSKTLTHKKSDSVVMPSSSSPHIESSQVNQQIAAPSIQSVSMSKKKKKRTKKKKMIQELLLQKIDEESPKESPQDEDEAEARSALRKIVSQVMMYGSKAAAEKGDHLGFDDGSE